MSISDIGPILLTCMFTSISSEGPGEKCLVISLMLCSVFTCKVWPETVVIVVKETVQQLAHVVGRLVGQQTAGDLVLRALLPGGLALQLLAGKQRTN